MPRIRFWEQTDTALRVPQITAFFWIAKGLSTAMGESTSDFLVHQLHPVPAVLLGFVGFVVGLTLQLSMGRYNAWTYWFAVVMVGVFGTMAADVMHVGLGVPYTASALFYGVVLAAIFVLWQRVEHTLSVHSIDSLRRELFYWAAVVATFALGTAVGDLTAVTFGWGYAASLCVFAALILVPAFGFRYGGWSPVVSFWFAYVATRPLGATFADLFGKSTADKGLGLGAGHMAALLTLLIAGVVAYLAITRCDVQFEPGAPNRGPELGAIESA